MIDFKVTFDELSGLESTDIRLGKVANGSTLTTTLDENFDYGTVNYINRSAKPFQMGQGVKISLGVRATFQSFDMLVSADAVTILERDGEATKYLHSVLLTERTVLLSKYSFGGMAFPRINGRTWTLKEAFERVLATEPLRLNNDPLCLNTLNLKPFKVDSVPELDIPEINLGPGTLLEALNSLAKTVDRVVKLVTGSGNDLVTVREFSPLSTAAQTTKVYNYKSSLNFSDYGDNAVAFITDGIPSGKAMTGGPFRPSTPRSETVFCSTDNLRLQTDFPIYKIEKIYAMLAIGPSTNNLDAHYKDLGRETEADGYTTIKKGVAFISHPALGFVKLDITDYFVTSGKFETMSFEDKNMHFCYAQGSSSIELTANAQSNPYFRETKINNVINAAWSKNQKSYYDKVSGILANGGFSSAVNFPSANLSPPLLSDLTSHRGFDFMFMIEYIPLIQARLMSIKPGVTKPSLSLVATQSSSPVEIEKLGQNTAALMARTGNEEILINRSISSSAELNYLRTVLAVDGSKYVLAEQTIISNLSRLDVSEKYIKNFNRRLTYTGVDLVYRETVKDGKDVPRYLNYYSKTPLSGITDIKSYIDERHFYAVCELLDLSGTKIGTTFMVETAATIYGNSIAFIFDFSGSNIVGNSVVDTGGHKELVPVPISKAAYPRQNRLKIKIVSDYPKNIVEGLSAANLYKATTNPVGNSEFSVIHLAENALLELDIDQIDPLGQGNLQGTPSIGEKVISAAIACPSGYYVLQKCDYAASTTINFENAVRNNINKAYRWLGDSLKAVSLPLTIYSVDTNESDQTAVTHDALKQKADKYPEYTDLNFASIVKEEMNFDLRVDKADTEKLIVSIQIPLTG